MARPTSAQEAWEELRRYAREPDATIKTAVRGSENEIGVDSTNAIVFRKGSGTKRKVSREEFTAIWDIFERKGEISRKEVGEQTAERVGSALFGAMNEILEYELERSGSSARLQRTNESR